MLLRNFDFAQKYFDYKSKIEVKMTTNPRICGWYKYINGLLSALIVIDGKLYFLYGEERFLISESHRVLLKRGNKFEINFSLKSENLVLVKFIYSLHKPNFNASPFEYIDLEDFNWGDFIEKIINDEKRKTNFVLNIMESR